VRIKVARTITPIVRRHVSDAAFYWQQLDTSAHSPLINFDRWQHFCHILNAHLEGVLVAGKKGLDICLTDLERWSGSGEAFTTAYSAFHHDSEEVMQQLLTITKDKPHEVMRGIISALAWLDANRRKAYIETWITRDDEPVLQVIALRNLAICGDFDETFLRHFDSVELSGLDVNVKAALCRVISTQLRMQGQLSELHRRFISEALNDPALNVRAEAAIAVSSLGIEFNAAQSLEQTIDLRNQQIQCLDDSDHELAERQLIRWLRHFAIISRPTTLDLNQLIHLLSPRTALQFVLLHGDVNVLPWVVNQMNKPETQRLAGWVWQTMTGLDLQDNEMELEADVDQEELSDDDLVNLANVDVDAGLPIPDLEKIQYWMSVNASSLPVGQVSFLGEVCEKQTLWKVLEKGDCSATAWAKY